jgi:dephospho-CoA kinase
VVLTGGIASGKTAVSDYFATKGVPIVDTDKIARDLVQPGQAILESIADEFGPDFLLSDGSLDRSKMRTAIFSDNCAKTRLEAILHPAIAKETTKRIKLLSAPYCILVIPLFIESSSYGWVDRVLVVDVPEETQIERVMTRDSISRDEANAIIRSQSSRQQRLEIANDVIDNRCSISRMHVQVDELHLKYLEAAAANS